MNDKQKVGKSILFSVFALVVFFFCYIAVASILSTIFFFLLQVPVIKSLLGFLFATRGDSPDILSIVVGVLVAYSLVTWMFSRVHKDSLASENLSLRITGISLIVFNVLFLIINVGEGTPFIGNILCIIAGVIMFSKGR